MMFNQPQALLKLLQLVSPVLPVGAYSYSEGLETLTQTGQVTNAPTLEHWLLQELRYGAIAVEAAMLVQAYRHLKSQDSQSLNSSNAWLSAFRETEELRLQSWQMGRSLTRLLSDLDASIALRLETLETPLNFALVFAIAAAHWQIPLEPALMGYLHSWAANLVNAGVRLIPLGQTQGQQVLLHLYPDIEATTARVLSQTQDELETCGWGLAIASMNHQTLYSRLFRS